jgi:hypothetical protein
MTDGAASRSMILLRLTLAALLPAGLYVPLSVLMTWRFGWYNGPAVWEAPETVVNGCSTFLHVGPLLIGFSLLPLPANPLHWRIAAGAAYAAIGCLAMEALHVSLHLVGFHDKLFS